jgi:hypothetical protein
VSLYTQPDLAVREEGVHEACRAAVAIPRVGHAVFSRSYTCDELVVLMLDGRRDSAACRGEIEMAKAFGKSIGVLEPTLVDLPATSALPHVATGAASRRTDATNEKRSRVAASWASWGVAGLLGGELTVFDSS